MTYSCQCVSRNVAKYTLTAQPAVHKIVGPLSQLRSLWTNPQRKFDISFVDDLVFL